MRVEFAMASPAPIAAPAAGTRRWRLDPYEALLLALFAAISVWVLGLDLWQVVVHHRVWTGTDGFFIVDQLQYLAWIKAASHHVLASNMFVLRPTPADYFQPAVAVSGLVTRLGVAPWLALLMWKPVAVLGMFYGTRAYIYRSLNWGTERRIALTLALFYGSFSIVYGTFGVVGDLFPGFLSWGYPFGLMAMAVMMFALLRYDRDRRRGTVSWVVPTLGALASLLHPWQGELLVTLIVVAEVLRWREWRAWRGTIRARLTLPLVTLLATGLPLGYYMILGHVDLSWGLAQQASKHSFSFWSLCIAMAPLAIVAALGYRGPAKTFLDTLTRGWPLAALVVYVVSATSVSATPLHAFEGITVPLAILAVAGVQRARWTRVPGRRWLIAGALVVATVPATTYELAIAPTFMGPQNRNANFIARGERDALDYLADNRESGGVLSRFYLGSLVPGRTGRRTFVGNCLWSEPYCIGRAQMAQRLFDGTLTPQAGRDFVAQSGARFLLRDCRSPGDLGKYLGAMVVSTTHFGCASVIELEAQGRPMGPLAESGANAAVRASRRQ
jgi:hypothetical protein